MHPEIICITPFEQPDITLLGAIARTSALAVLDLGHDRQSALRALERAERARLSGFGVCLHDATAELELPRAVCAIISDRPRAFEPAMREGRWFLTQVCSLEEAEAARAYGSDALIVKGCEAGGRVGEETSFVLLQRLLAQLELPLWVQGGIGVHTAPALRAGGAHGVVLDAQLALMLESSFPAELRARIEAMTGDETRVIEGRRVLRCGQAPRARDAGASVEPHAQEPAWLAAGQDASFAAELAARYESTRRVVEAFERSMRALPEQARRLQPLGEGHGIAETHGTRYPIAQGPMTRVSDNPAFAAAVADAGGLPFIALALLRGSELRQLLLETAQALGARAWGVGILGFAPDAIRAEQLAVVRELRPPLALIAGARVALARELSELGITSYLHVPSPRLLDQFIKQGLRHFVVEGSECGGHIGPRTSLTLWEQTVSRLARESNLHGYHLLFAGGIHDARSAAMVSVLAAPLCARGARCGALMGTAYLFTREAVATGAITGEYQAQALAAQRTVVLESGPGHATRALDSPFCARFQAERARLSSAGLSPEAIGAALEELNLGRLRVASKGIVRQGAQLTPISSEQQRGEGLYMSGQVAALRGSITTVEQLHRELSEGGKRLLGERPRTRPRTNQTHDIAIVGMACIYPGADDADQFWANVLSGASFVSEVPEQRWQHALYFGARGERDKTSSKWGGFLSPQAFDPLELGIPPRALPSLDPAQILALLVAERALRDARVSQQAIDRSRIGVVVGAEASADITAQYLMRAFLPGLIGALPPELDARLLSFTEDSFPGVLANVIAGRLSNRLDLGGPNYAVNAACASSLAALDCACRELESGSCDLVLAGGVDVHNSIYDYLMFTSVQALSPSGTCKTFDAGADGIALAEGVGFVALKRFADAVADGDRIYARIRGVASSSDGRSQSLTAPRPDGQLRVLRSAYERAGVDAAEVELIEAHGTGTVMGDRVELEVLTEFLREAGAGLRGCAVGSVKSQIGHAKCAAGMAGLIKTAFALHHGVIPPTRNLERPNACYDAATSPFVFHTEARPWFAPVRTAGVSAFGFGGTNYHAVLESAGEPAQAPSTPRIWPSELIVFRAPSRARAFDAVRALEARLASAPLASLLDIAAAAAGEGDREQPAQLAIVASSAAQLVQTLRAIEQPGQNVAGAFWAEATPIAGPIAFLFPGQGSQRVGMLRELSLYFPEVRASLAALGELNAHLFPPLGGEDTTALRDTRNAQPALGAADLALCDVLARFGVRAASSAGHSYGELAALCHAGAIPREDLLELSHARAQAMLESLAGQQGAMTVIVAPSTTAAALLEGIEGAWLANLNSPSQSVIAGELAAIERVEERARARGQRIKRLTVPYAFHTPRLLPAQHAFERVLARFELAPPVLPVFSNADAAPYPEAPSAIRQLLSRQLAEPVRFEALVRRMHDAGARVFVEVGPSEVLTGLVREILKGTPHLAVATDRPGRSGMRALLEALAQLSVAGVAIDERRAFDGRDPGTLRLDAPLASKSAWRADGARVWNVDAPVKNSAPVPLAITPVLDAGADRQRTVREYLELTRQLVESQREVMLAYLQPGAITAPHARASRQPTALVSTNPQAGAPTQVDAAIDDAAAPTLAPEDCLKELFAERTGYPVEMLSATADLEAELGIDSIKRMEVLQVLVERLQPHAVDERERIVERLLKLRTIGAIVAELAQRSASDVVPSAEHAAPEPPVEVAAGDDGVEQVARRSLTRLVPMPIALEPAHARAHDLRRVAVTSEVAEITGQVIADLRGVGLEASAIDEPEQLVAGFDALVCLSAVDREDRDPAKRGFAFACAAARCGVRSLLMLSALGGELGLEPNAGSACGGVSGLIKSFAKEHERMRCRVLDVALTEGKERIADYVTRELLAADHLLEVGYREDARSSLRATPEARPLTLRVALGREDVVLLLGGARGITAALALGLHQRFGCRLVLGGRSDPKLAEAYAPLGDPRDAVCARRAVLARDANLAPNEVERHARRLRAASECAQSLTRLERAGARFSYHPLDVRDRRAVHELIATAQREHGRIDGVIHAAGVLEDGLAQHKQQAAFDRVYDTKVEGARNLLELLPPEVRFVLFFSSVAGFYGNAGQTDYAAANEWLDVLARTTPVSANGPRLRSIAWGPWADVGMVSSELERVYRARGVELIDPELGVAECIDELVYGDRAHVVLTAASSEGRDA